LPFQCGIKVWPVTVPPTAQALAAEVAATPARWPLRAEAAGPRDPFRAAAAVTGETVAATPASNSGTATSLAETLLTRVRFRRPPLVVLVKNSNQEEK